MISRYWMIEKTIAKTTAAMAVVISAFFLIIASVGAEPHHDRPATLSRPRPDPLLSVPATADPRLCASVVSHRLGGSKLASILPARQTRTTPSDSLTVKAIDFVLAVMPAAVA